ncbi:motile sperm domain-containing protein 2 [Octopus bimaculoides]|nr:motile sperm domain-containing protein 2 [Octopus bimaculoides]
MTGRHYLFRRKDEGSTKNDHTQQGAHNQYEPATPDHMSSVRQVFLDKYRDNIEKGCYDDRDLEKIKTDDFLLELYCRHQPKAKVEEVASLIHESLKWRMEYQINDLSDDSFDDKMWEQRAIFFHNTDKDGHKVLITQVKMHRKGDSHYLLTVKKFFAWHIEKAFQENPGEPLMLLFDMDGAGLANLDMDFIRFCINCFKSNYPCILGLMLVYEMPWIFNGELLCLTSMCLTSMWFCQIFLLFYCLMRSFTPADKVHSSYTASGTMFCEPDTVTNSKISPDGASSSRKVKISEPSSLLRSYSSDSFKEGSRLPLALSSLEKKFQNKDNCFQTRLLSIRPADELCFQLDENVKEIYSTISLSNTLTNPIAYKVKTTSPEKFRVRPSGGVVRPGSPVTVNVHIQPGFENKIQSDKFLVRAMEVTDESKDVAELWKTVQRESIMEHRLRCIINSEPVCSKPANDIATLTEKVEVLQSAVSRIERRQQHVILLQLVFLLVVILAIVSDYWQSLSAPQDHKSKYCQAQ